MNYFDNLFNSISKGSAYYITDLKTQNEAFEGRPLDLTITAAMPSRPDQSKLLFWKAGVAAEADGTQITVRGDLGRILAACLEDADLLFRNQDDSLRAKYDIDGREVMYTWWGLLKELDKALKNEKRFEDAKFVSTVQAKAVEVAFNFYGIEPQKIMDKLGIVVFALAFYVLYTLWFGFAIMYMFEGWGMELEH